MKSCSGNFAGHFSNPYAFMKHMFPKIMQTISKTRKEEMQPNKVTRLGRN
jgi:hypothetical protein